MKLNNFKAYELVDKTTYELHGEKCVQMFDRELLIFIDGLHHRLSERYSGKISIIINDWKWGGKFQWRGMRNVTYYGDVTKFNKSRSQHKYGKALDFDVHVNGVRISPDVIRDIIVECRGEHLITFIEDDVNWVHVDMRPTDNDLLVKWSPITGKVTGTYTRKGV